MLVLSLDGGGIKGVTEARLLQRLEHAAPFLGNVELFAGTSTGGIIALALASGLSPADCVSLYKDNAEAIFASRGAADYFSGGLDEYVRADYAQDGLREVLEDAFGGLRLPDLETDVLLPCFDLARFRPKFLDCTDDWSLVDAGLATAAAPTIFPVHVVRENMDRRVTSRGSVRALVDGGVYCNNPSRAALDFARNKLGAETVELLSVGAGAVPYSPPKELLESAKSVLDWGVRQWAVKNPHLILKVLFDGSVTANHYSTKADLGDSYHRIQPVLPEPVELDDCGKVGLLLSVADSYDIGPARAWAKKHGGR